MNKTGWVETFMVAETSVQIATSNIEIYKLK